MNLILISSSEGKEEINKNYFSINNKDSNKCISFPNKNSEILYSLNRIKFNKQKCEDNYEKQNQSIKHYILVRFYCLNMMDKEKLFDKKILDNGVKVFEKYTLKSLENQSNQNFEIIINIHNEIDLNHESIQKLFKIKSNLKINIVRYKDVNSFIENNLKNEKFLITTRIDHDDLIYNNAVQEIQSKCNKDIPLYYNGYDRFITMINDDYINTYKFYPEYHGNGSVSIFQSLIVNLEKINKVYNIYELKTHTLQKKPFMKLYELHNFKYKEEYFNINHLEDCCIYIKHWFNLSVSSIPSYENRWHRTSIKVNQSKKWFINRFGNFIK